MKLVAPHVEELRELLGMNVLLLAWPWGRKGTKRKWGHLTVESMNDPAYLKKLGRGNIGVAQGRVSGDLCSLDIDDDEEMEQFLALNPAICNTLRSRGNRGCNFWWRIEGGYPGLKPLKRHGKDWGEWRANGGQTIIYGQHPNGKPYEILNRVKPITIKMIEIQWPEGIYPLLQGGSMSNDTETTLGTEQIEKIEKIEKIQPIEQIEANSSGVAAGCVLASFKSFEELARQFLPTAEHQSHGLLFKLARGAKAIEQAENRILPQSELRQIFLHWYRGAESFLRVEVGEDAYYFEFLEAYENALHPLGIDVVAKAWELAQKNPVPKEAEQFSTNQVRLLVSLCREMWILQDKAAFFLSCRTVQRLLALSTPMQAWRLLNGLSKTGILKLSEKGDMKTMKATRFIYLPEVGQ